MEDHLLVKGLPPDTLTADEVRKVRAIIEADHAASMMWSLIRRIAGYTAAALASLYIIWRVALDYLNFRGH